MILEQSSSLNSVSQVSVKALTNGLAIIFREKGILVLSDWPLFPTVLKVFERAIGSLVHINPLIIRTLNTLHSSFSSSRTSHHIFFFILVEGSFSGP
jgi:hypothetical protein